MKSIWTISRITPLLTQDAVNVEFEHLHGNLCFTGLVMRAHGFKPEIGGKFAFEYIPAETEFQKQSRMANLAQQLCANQINSGVSATNQDHQNPVRQKWGNDPFIGGQQMYPAMPKAPLFQYVAATEFNEANQYLNSGNREWYNDAGTGTMQNQASQFINNPALPYIAITAFKAALPDPSIFGLDVRPEESESDRIARVTQSMCK